MTRKRAACFTTTRIATHRFHALRARARAEAARPAWRAWRLLARAAARTRRRRLAACFGEWRDVARLGTRYFQMVCVQDR